MSPSSAIWTPDLQTNRLRPERLSMILRERERERTPLYVQTGVCLCSTVLRSLKAPVWTLDFRLESKDFFEMGRGRFLESEDLSETCELQQKLRMFENLGEIGDIFKNSFEICGHFWGWNLSDRFWNVNSLKRWGHVWTEGQMFVENEDICIDELTFL